MVKKNRKNKAKKSGSAHKPDRGKKVEQKTVPVTVNQAFHLALHYFQTGDLQQSENLCLKLLEVDPGNAEVMHFLGYVIAQQKGRHDLAVKYIQKSLSLKPDNAEAHNNLCLALQDSGRLDEAVISCRKALSIRPDFAEAYNNLGNALRKSGELDEAIVTYQKAISLNQGYAEAHNNLGITYQEAGRFDKAIDNSRKALSLKPGYIEAHINLGISFKKSGKLKESEASFRKALTVNPENEDTYNYLGNTLQELGKSSEAIANYKMALSINPDYAEAYANLATLLHELGQLDQAVANYKKALSIKPDYAYVYRQLSRTRKFTVDDDSIRKIKKLYEKKDLVDEDRMHLGFALGKISEDIKDYESSFNYIIEANKIKRGTYEYSTRADSDYFERVKQVFSPNFFASAATSGCIDETPIFILGMPRSGTTLVEQILSSHPEVYGAGELLFLADLMKDECSKTAEKKFPECIAGLERGSLKILAEGYINELRKYSRKTKYITDKMPYNFLRVGLIKLILPKAKIIHCTRDPMDNCYSIFKNFFTGSHNYAYRLDELGHYYKLYLSLMEHWEKILPGFMYNIKYEEVIADQLLQTKGLLEYCRLPWDDACLDFHKTERRVKTASNVQVRKPIYKDSVKLWKRYEKQLEPLRRAIYG